MVDYFALIAPTIESLSKSTIEERRQVYDRLIKMLEAQLRSADPPRSEIDILRERIDLEAAIRRVERRIQAGQIAVGTPLNPDALRPIDEQMGMAPPVIAPKPKSLDPSPVPPPVADDDEPGFMAPDQDPHEVLNNSGPSAVSPDAPYSASQMTVADAPEHPAEPPPTMQSFRFPDANPEAGPVPPRPTDWASLVPQPRPVDRQVAFSPRSVPRPQQAPMPYEQRPVAPPASSPPTYSRQSTEPSSGELPPGPPRRQIGTFQTPSEPSQGEAAQSQPLSREPDLGRPIYGQKDAAARPSASRLADLPAAFRSLPGAPGPRRPLSTGDGGRQDIAPPLDPAVIEAGQSLSEPLKPRPPREPQSPPANFADPTEFLRNQANPKRTGRRRETIVETSGNETPRPTVSIGERPRASLLPTRGSGGMQRLAIISACVVAILGGIAATAYMLRDDPSEFENAAGKYAANEKPAAEEKISDRLQTQTPAQNVTPAKPGGAQSNGQQTNAQQAGSGPQAPAAPTPDANGVLTQKAMLLMESNDTAVTATPINGRVTWKLETLKSVVANASEIGSRATVDFPEVGLSTAFVFRRNRDPQSANSHMIEVTFTLAENNVTGKVRDIRVPELRTDEVARGTALSGVPVPVTENVFLVGLNALPSEMQKNLDLLRSQNWFAMPLRFANGKRGILMFEKGKTGERVMEDAMQAWKVN